MKKFAYSFIILGVVIMIVGIFIWPNLNHVNMVDSNTWTVNINGYKSFRWPVFLGGVIFVIGAMALGTLNTAKGRRFR